MLLTDSRGRGNPHSNETKSPMARAGESQAKAGSGIPEGQKTTVW